jgi:very-short-patch-repair endonuclease
MPESRIERFKRTAAKRLRTNATNAEIVLWRRLKRLETRGTHFRRQAPIGKFIVDFACPAARLVIEVDGSQHGEEYGRTRDQQRTQWLASEGYRVMRFWNNDITGNIEGVMEAIYDALYSASFDEKHVFKHQRSRSKSIS